MLPAYAELHCISNFSFLQGTSHPEELVERAAALGYAALAITDECSVAGAVRAHVAAKDFGLKLLIGSEFRLIDGPKLVLLAMNRAGYGNLSALITRARCAAKKGTYRITRSEFEGGIAECLALLVPDDADCAADAAWLRERFPGTAWIAVELLRGPDDTGWLRKLEAVSYMSGVPLVAAGDVRMHVRARKPLHDVLTAIRLRTPVARLGRQLLANSERHLRAIGRLAAIYPPALLAETLAVAARCDFSLDELRYEYPEEIVPACETPISWLRHLSDEGMARRYPAGAPESVRNTVERELALIDELDYAPYFLTVHDLVAFARSRGILCQGRGSAANSAVCYCLGITEVDPGRMQMLFERFVSRERREPPDIDVDFEHERREEVLQYVFAKYGRARAAMTAAVSTYHARGALRDVAKALGLSLDQADRLAKAVAWREDRGIVAETLREAGFDQDSRVIAQVIALANTLIGFPRHLSQHSGGVVIARDRLDRLVPIENAAMPERTVIQWDKDDLDLLGLLKIDILALGMLTAIRRTLDLTNAWHGTQRTLADIPPEDPAAYDMACNGDTVGVFQIESRAQMSMLPRLKPRCYYDLVIEVAIVRPGPIQGRMVHPYLRRREGSEPVTYPSEAVKSVLERTLGVSIFQEQVMQLAVVAAGFTPGEADRLRRAMAAWKRHGGLEPFRERLLDGMRARGYSAEYAEQIYQQIRGFGAYGFPESHSASFALLVYASLWLKCHHPAAFTAALLNSQPMGFYSPAQIVQDARRHGVTVRPADVTTSDWEATLEPDDDGKPAVRLGLQQVSGLPERAADAIVAARAARPFEHLEDFVRRTAVNRHDLTCLAAADALASIAGHRRSALWQTLGTESMPPLLGEGSRHEVPPEFLVPTEGENIVADYAHLGLTLRRHPVALLRPRLKALRLLSATELGPVHHGSWHRHLPPAAGYGERCHLRHAGG